MTFVDWLAGILTSKPVSFYFRLLKIVIILIVLYLILQIVLNATLGELA